ncbi:FAD-binding monooxygenase [Nocardioides albidus]|uniref:FAD-binding monooxygenase n=1 Tax=Nocardioides albidus TaxID=1517589 RepID=A0A5C4VRT1_9ACTN|nr:FAD-dependent monooxygenase [Nocardioides albidus]TNM38265.1 FAD-binding monooxygenase [Nocardioides albidus]
MSIPDCDVLVVGAGPTGLTLALQLLSRGVRTRIVDQDPGSPKMSRAIGLQPRTLETLDMMGIADRLVEIGHRTLRTSVYVGGRRRLGIDMTAADSAYRFILHLPQNRTEEVLRTRLAELGGEVERGVELVDLVQHGDEVTAALRDVRGHESRTSASYLVGCDGAHSRVRQLLAVPFEGAPYPFEWLLADAELDGVASDDEVHVYWGSAAQPLALIPIDGRLWRVSAPVRADRDGAAPTLEEIQELVDTRGPGGIVVRSPETLTCFRCQIRSTGTYRVDRVLLAGDAAHIHAPTGAQGMNLGINDAANLGWKLADVVTARAPGALLDSYGAERRPAAQQVMAMTDGMVRFILDPSPVRRALRRAIMPALRTPLMQRRLADRMAQLAIAYPDSPLSRPGRVRGVPRPGARMPNIRLHDGRTLHEALRAGLPVLAGPADGLPASVLVRPDGYVAAVGPQAEGLTQQTRSARVGT